MRKMLDMVDLKAIEALATYGPRSISEVSKKYKFQLKHCAKGLNASTPRLF